MVLARIARARGSRAPEVLSNGSAILVSSVLAGRALDRRATVDRPRHTACCALGYKPRATLKRPRMAGLCRSPRSRVHDSAKASRIFFRGLRRSRWDVERKLY